MQVNRRTIAARMKTQDFAQRLALPTRPGITLAELRTKSC